MNPNQYNKSMIKAIKIAGDAGYKVTNVSIYEASWNKGKLTGALFGVFGNTLGNTYELRILVAGKDGFIQNIKQIIN